MNKENVLAVADAIENHTIDGLGFNMFDFLVSGRRLGVPDMSGHGCGTTACIAGWAVAVRDQTPNVASKDFFGEGRDYLGLSEAAAENLFIDHASSRTMQAEAVAVLRHLAETGKVDWSIAAQPVSP